MAFIKGIPGVGGAGAVIHVDDGLEDEPQLYSELIRKYGSWLGLVIYYLTRHGFRSTCRSNYCSDRILFKILILIAAHQDIRHPDIIQLQDGVLADLPRG